MTARLRSLLPVAIILLFVSVSGGQERGQRGASRPGAQPQTDRGPGTVNSPGRGYVVLPEAAPPGDVHAPPIPIDSIDLAFWELYDRNNTVTISGKVTSVNMTTPNAYIRLQANSGEWVVEAPFSQFLQAKVKPAISAGQTITVSGFLPRESVTEVPPASIPAALASYKNAKHLIRAGEITTAQGQKLKMGQPPSEEDAKAREDALQGLLKGQQSSH